MHPVYKCKKCGQLICKYEGLADFDVQHVFDELKKNGYYVHPIPPEPPFVSNSQRYEYRKSIKQACEDLSNSFPFIGIGSIVNQTIVYPLEDLKKFNECLERYKQDGIIFLHDGNTYNFGKCPICNSTEGYKILGISRNSDKKLNCNYYVSNIEGPEKEEYQSRKEELQQYVYAEDSQVTDPKCDMMVQECKDSVDFSHQLVINSSQIEIQPYLKGLLTIKTNELSLERRLQELLHEQIGADQFLVNTESKISSIGVENIRHLYDETKKRIKEITNPASFSIPSDWYKNCSVDLPPEEPIMSYVFNAQPPKEPVYLKPGLFNKKAIADQNQALKDKYEAQLAEYRADEERYNEELQKWETAHALYEEKVREFNSKRREYHLREYRKWVDVQSAENPELKQLIDNRKNYEIVLNNSEAYVHETLANSPAIVLKKLNDEEIEQCLNALKEAYQTENDYLSVGVLFPKYTSLPAVTSICEYFATGRCQELTGPTGAYNLYESELRSNMIIEKLDLISDKLDDIKRNQFMLFNAINSVNSQLKQLNAISNKVVKELTQVNYTLGKIDQKAAVIEYNTAAAAYYTKRSAELTNSLGYLLALK